MRCPLFLAARCGAIDYFLGKLGVIAAFLGHGGDRALR